MSFRAKLLLGFCIFILITFSILKTLVLFEIVDSTTITRGSEFVLLLILFPSLFSLVRCLIYQSDKELQEHKTLLIPLLLYPKQMLKVE